MCSLPKNASFLGYTCDPSVACWPQQHPGMGEGNRSCVRLGSLIYVEFADMLCKSSFEQFRGSSLPAVGAREK